MRFLKLAMKNRETHPASWDAVYENEIIRKIRRRYTVNQELAILRQRDSKPSEFAEYNAYVERCKDQVRSELEIRKDTGGE